CVPLPTLLIVVSFLSNLQSTHRRYCLLHHWVCHDFFRDRHEPCFGLLWVDMHLLAEHLLPKLEEPASSADIWIHISPSTRAMLSRGGTHCCCKPHLLEVNRQLTVVLSMPYETTVPTESRHSLILNL
uniref:Uncharacterized protein n=1 Tax=Triticum urartu TaxID=4572 RepID=A0A8R7P3V9_TRIUA